MVSSVSNNIVSTGENPLKTWAEAQDKKRMDNLQRKSDAGTISKLEKAELCTRKVAEAIKAYAPHSVSFGSAQSSSPVKMASDFTMEDMQKLVERKSKGLSDDMAKQIAALPAEQRALFFEKDYKGNYMLPTKVLNQFHCKLEVGEERYKDKVILTNFGSSIDKYVIYKENGPIPRMVISKIGSKARLETVQFGEYRNTTDSILNNHPVEKGNTEDIDKV